MTNARPPSNGRKLANESEVNRWLGFGCGGWINCTDLTTEEIGKMNLNDLTIGEAKQLAEMFCNAPNVTSLPSVANGKGLIGKYVIVRSRNEGVNAGVIQEMDETGVVIREARRIWYHRPADKSMAWYEGVALTGLSDGSKVSAEVPLKAIIEDYSITVCTEVAEKSIREHKTHAQN